MTILDLSHSAQDERLWKWKITVEQGHVALRGCLKTLQLTGLCWASAAGPVHAPPLCIHSHQSALLGHEEMLRWDQNHLPFSFSLLSLLP